MIVRGGPFGDGTSKRGVEGKRAMCLYSVDILVILQTFDQINTIFSSFIIRK
jgi:hypothetical protein